MHLGAILRDEPAIKAWLKSERKNYSSPNVPCGWTNPIPAPL